MKKKQALRTLFIAAIFCVAALSAQAQEQDAELEKVTVTANKMEEDVQKVPQTISVIDATELEEKGIKTTFDLLNEIPSMLPTPDHGVGVTFRGLKRSMFTENNPVVLYLNGVPVTNSFGFDLNLLNIERVEVLRGPQGSLYGKDAIGAVVNIVTKNPDNNWHGKVGAEYGSFNTLQTTAAVNGPVLADKVFLGLSGRYDKTDSWIKNIRSGMNEKAGRNDKYDIDGYFLFTPTEELRIRLGGNITKDNQHSEKAQVLSYGSGYKDLSAFDRDMAKKLKKDIEDKMTTKSNSQNLSVSYNFGDFTLTSVTTRRQRDSDGVFDGDYTSGTLADGLIMFHDNKLSTLTEELRLAANNTEGLRWVGGIYLDKDKEDAIMGQQMPGAMFGSPVPMEMQSVSDLKAQTGAVFGQVMLPFLEQFELTLGGRYQQVKKEIDQKMYILPVQGKFYANVKGVTPAQKLDTHKTWNTFLPKAALAYFISDKYTAYTSFAKGYMPGGFNYFSSGGGAKENTFKPQQSTNYEIGIKADHGKWRFNLAAFYMDITDIHIYKSVAGQYMTDNANKAHSFGTELEATWLPLQGMELTTALSVMEAKYDDYDEGTVKHDGKNMEGSPSFSGRIGACYHHTSGVYARADVNHVGNVHYYDGSAKTLQKADPYTLADIKLGFLYDNWDIYAFVKNLSDEKYINAFKSSMGMGAAGFGTPRTFGVGLSYSF